VASRKLLRLPRRVSGLFSGSADKVERSGIIGV
jgi:hypothetical protein